MAVTAPRLVAVVAMAVLGVGAGYGVGEYTQPGVPTPVGQAVPMLDAPAPIPSPTPKKRVAEPNDTEPLDPDRLEYKTKTFTATEDIRSAVTVQVPVGWNMTRPEEDEARYTDPLNQRWIRIEAGTLIQTPPAALMRGRNQNLRTIDPAADLALLSQRDATMTATNGVRLTVSTMAYTYIPDKVPLTRRYVLVRWIAFGESPNTAVEISVTGLPQDKKGLEAILDRATKTVRRKD
jgi:hypothetical protein